MTGPVSWEIVPLPQRDGVNVIVGQSHFVKTVEDLHEAIVGAGAGIRFGIAFCEASGPRLVRYSGNDPELTEWASAAAVAIGAGHSFVVLLRNGFPINVLNPIRRQSDPAGGRGDRPGARHRRGDRRQVAGRCRVRRRPA